MAPGSTFTALSAEKQQPLCSLKPPEAWPANRNTPSTNTLSVQNTRGDVYIKNNCENFFNHCTASHYSQKICQSSMDATDLIHTLISSIYKHKKPRRLTRSRRTTPCSKSEQLDQLKNYSSIFSGLIYCISTV